MKFSLSDLKKFLTIEPNISTSSIEEKLNNIGLEVESIVDQKNNLKNIVLGYVKNVKKHPNADKLNICTVDIGAEDLQIVCGASNVKKGIFVAVAKIGAIIPNGKFVIKKSKIRSIESKGMICSENELSISAESEGIMHIDAQSEQVGQEISNILKLNETIFDISITPNKGDCLSILGVARALASANFGVINENYINNIIHQSESFSIENLIKTHLKNEKNILIESSNCDAFSLMQINNITNKSTPDYIKKTLKSSGFNSHDLIIDATNYIMIMIGKPTHAYDANQLVGDKIYINNSTSDDFVDLKNISHNLDNTLVVKDEKNVISIAGIIGGKNSSINNDTKNVLLESASFKSEEIYKSGQKLNIISEARTRFERGIDLELNEISLKLLASIIKLENPNAQISNIKSKILNQNKQNIDFDTSIISSLLGIEMELDDIISILEKNYYKIINVNDSILTLEIPNFKTNITHQENIVSEIMMSVGLDKIKQPKFDLQSFKTRTKKLDLHDIQYNIIKYLSHHGYKECINYSFGSLKDIALFSQIEDKLKIVNPININMEYLYPTKIISHIKTIANNIKNYRFDQIQLSEKGAIYLDAQEDSTIESISITKYFNRSVCNEFNLNHKINEIKSEILNITGRYFFINPIDIDFSIIDNNSNTEYINILNLDSTKPNKSKILNLIGKLKIRKNFFSDQQFYVAKIKNIPIAIFGKISKHVIQKLDINQNDYIIAAEIYSENLSEISQNSQRQSKISESVYRSFSILINNQIEINSILRFIRDQSNKLIINQRLIEIYSNKEYEKENNHSLNIEIEIIKSENSDTTEKINNILFDCINLVTNKFNAILRDKKI